MRCFIVIAAGACGLLALAPAPASAQVDAAGRYPVCSAGMQDACQNPGEGGAPGRSRASDENGGPAAYAATAGSAPRHHAVRHKKMRHHRRR